jgi:hypothetical protein
MIFFGWIRPLLNLNPAVQPPPRPALGLPSTISNCPADHRPGDNRFFRKQLRPMVGGRLAGWLPVRARARVPPIRAVAARRRNRDGQIRQVVAVQQEQFLIRQTGVEAL